MNETASGAGRCRRTQSLFDLWRDTERLCRGYMVPLAADGGPSPRRHHITASRPMAPPGPEFGPTRGLRH